MKYVNTLIEHKVSMFNISKHKSYIEDDPFTCITAVYYTDYSLCLPVLSHLHFNILADWKVSWKKDDT